MTIQPGYRQAIPDRSAPRPRAAARFLLDALLIFTLLLAAYSLTFSGVPLVEDEQLIAARAQSLAQDQGWGYPQLYGNDRVRALAAMPAASADLHVAVEPAASLLASFLYRLGRWLSAGGTQAAMLTNLYLTALTGVLVYAIVRAAGSSRTTAWSAALLYGLGTMAWPYARTLFRDVLLASSATAATLGFVLLEHRRKPMQLLGLSLLACGLIAALLTKRSAWVLVLALAATCLLEAGGSAGARPRRLRRLAFMLLAAGAVLALAALLPERGLLARFSLAHFRYAFDRMASGAWGEVLTAFAGPFVSPAKSIFLFSPVLLLAPAGLLLGWRDNRRLYIFILSTILLLAGAQALFYREQWAGIPVWGLRFILLALPLLAILLAPVIDRLLEARNAFLQGGFIALAGLSLLIQLAGAAVAWFLPLLVWYRRDFDPYLPASVWSPSASPIPIQLAALLVPADYDLAWLRVLPGQPAALLLPIGAAVLFLAGTALLLRAQAREPRPALLIPALVVAAAALMLPLAPGLPLLRDDPAAGGSRPGVRAAIESLAEEARPRDVVLVEPYAGPLWQAMMNQWDGPATWYSLPDRRCSPEGGACAGDAAYAVALEGLLEEPAVPPRLWYLCSAEAFSSSPFEALASGSGYRRVGSRAFDGAQLSRFERELP